MIPNPKMSSANVLFCPQPKDIQLISENFNILLKNTFLIDYQSFFNSLEPTD